MQNPTLKSLQNLMIEVKADLGNSQRRILEEIRELKELTTQKKRIIELEESAIFLSGGYEKKENEHYRM